MAFNGKLYQQERLSKEDVQLLLKAMNAYKIVHMSLSDSEVFLIKKLERMEKAFR